MLFLALGSWHRELTVSLVSLRTEVVALDLQVHHPQTLQGDSRFGRRTERKRSSLYHAATCAEWRIGWKRLWVAADYGVQRDPECSINTNIWPTSSELHSRSELSMCFGSAAVY